MPLPFLAGCEVGADELYAVVGADVRSLFERVKHADGVGRVHVLGNLVAGHPANLAGLVGGVDRLITGTAAEDERDDSSGHVLVDAGESVKALSEYLGHTDAGFTLRTYTHLMPSSAERTRRAIDAEWGSGDEADPETSDGPATA